MKVKFTNLWPMWKQYPSIRLLIPLAISLVKTTSILPKQKKETWDLNLTIGNLQGSLSIRLGKPRRRFVIKPWPDPPSIETRGDPIDICNTEKRDISKED